MSPKRLDRVAPPPTGSEWEVRFGTTEAAKGWQDMCSQLTNNTRAAFDQMRSTSRPPEDATHYQLRGAHLAPQLERPATGAVADQGQRQRPHHLPP